jgi:hypothetical protein
MYRFCFILFSCISCTKNYSPEIENVLTQAGKNRSELEKVLKHYAQNPADSLKLKAAKFLIINIPGKYSEYFDAPWNDVATVRLRWTSSSDKQRVLDAYGLKEPVKQDDITHIKADFLIENIDLAFDAWQKRPWNKHVSFDAFCEEILPYRIENEPLENWRRKAVATYADLDTVLNKPGTTAIQACSIINSILPRFRMDKDFSQMCFSQMMATNCGTCDNMAALTAFVMRALGIPVTIDFTPHWADLPNGHSWNTVLDSAGNHVSFMGTDSNPYNPHQGNTYRKSKAYRKMFALQRNIETADQHIPYLLQEHRYIKDVSSEHAGVADVVTVSLVDMPPPESDDYVYLAMYYNDAWYPVDWADCQAKSAVFTHVGNENIIYLPVYFANGRQIPAGDPFLLDTAGMTVFSAEPDTLLTFGDIAPTHLSYSPRMRNGVFECGDKPDFSDARPLHIIRQSPDVSYREVTLKAPVRCRYVRYKSPKDGFCNVSEIIFYGQDMEKIDGVNIGSPGAWDNSDRTCDKAFDGDVTTFFDAPVADTAWTGLDLGERKTIRKIRYYPRTDGVYIGKGDEYELFLKAKDRWTSLGKQTAANHDSIQYHAPSQGLFYLKNLTLNRKGDIILLSKGQRKYL